MFSIRKRPWLPLPSTLTCTRMKPKPIRTLRHLITLCMFCDVVLEMAVSWFSYSLHFHVVVKLLWFFWVMKNSKGNQNITCTIVHYPFLWRTRIKVWGNQSLSRNTRGGSEVLISSVEGRAGGLSLPFFANWRPCIFHSGFYNS